MSHAERAGDEDLPRRAAGGPAPEGARREQAVHAVGRAPVLDLRRLPRGGDRHRGRAPRVDGGVRGGGLGEGDARAGRVRADGRAGRDQRDERDGLRAGQPLADGGARRPRAGAALGAGLAAGDRPRAVRAAADASWRRRRESTEEIPGLVDDAFAAACAPARRAGVRGLPARLRVHGGARAGGRDSHAAGRRAPARARARRGGAIERARRAAAAAPSAR